MTTIAHSVAIHSVKGKARYTVYHPTQTGVVVGTRLCEDHRYTHAVLHVSRENLDKVEVASMHGRLDLAQAAKATFDNKAWYNTRYMHVVVPMQLEIITPKKTAPQDKNATRRGVLTRQLNAQQKALAERKRQLAVELERGVPSHNYVESWGPERAATYYARGLENIRMSIGWCETAIAKLEAERDALLSAAGAEATFQAQLQALVNTAGKGR
jgi:hypothetical protein